MTNISLSRMTIKEIAKFAGLTLDQAMDEFYTSNTAKMLYTLDTDLNTHTPKSLAKLIINEQDQEND